MDERQRYGLNKEKNHTQAVVTYNWEGSQKYETSPWKARDSSSTSGTPTLRSWTGETSHQNTWLWKPTGNMSGKTIELQGMENQLLKGSQADLLKPKTSTKTWAWKAHGPQVKGTHLLTPRHLWQRQSLDSASISQRLPANSRTWERDIEWPPSQLSGKPNTFNPLISDC